MGRSALKVDGILHVEFISEGPWKKSCSRNKILDPFIQGNWGRREEGGRGEDL